MWHMVTVQILKYAAQAKTKGPELVLYDTSSRWWQGSLILLYVSQKWRKSSKHTTSHLLNVMASCKSLRFCLGAMFLTSPSFLASPGLSWKRPKVFNGMKIAYGRLHDTSFEANS